MNGALISLSTAGVPDVKRAIRILQLATHKFGINFVVWRAAIVCKDFIWFLPPRGKNPSKEGGNEQKERGWRCVERDIKRVFKSGEQLLGLLKLHPLVEQHPKLAAILERYIQAKDYANLSRVLYKMGSKVTLIPAPLQEQHFAERNRQTGRVFKNPRHRYYVLDDDRIQGYVTLRQRDVGKLKSGCLRAAEKLKMLGSEVKGIPAWVKRHHEPGDYVDETQKRGLAGFTIINQARGAERFAHILPAIVAINERKMLIEAKAKIPAFLRHYGKTSRLIYRV